jgi:hypothetical protein
MVTHSVLSITTLHVVRQLRIIYRFLLSLHCSLHEVYCFIAVVLVFDTLLH